MTDGERDRVHEMSRVIGGLEATVKNLTDTWRHQDEEATEGRRRLHAKFDDLMKSVIGLTGRVEQMSTEIAAMKPSVVVFDQQRHQAIGSRKMLAVIWSGVVVMVSAIAWSAIEIAHILWPPKH